MNTETEAKNRLSLLADDPVRSAREQALDVCEQAQRFADRTIADARETAERIVAEARAEAARILAGARRLSATFEEEQAS